MTFAAKVRLSTPDTDFDLGSLMKALGRQGIPSQDVAPFTSDNGDSIDSSEVLFVVGEDSSAVGEDIFAIRDQVGDDARICACMASAADQRVFRKKADEVLVPRTWHPDTIAERIAAACHSKCDASTGQFAGIYGRTPSMLKMFDEIQRYGDIPDPVLINGESGTGKELISKALHEQSPRANGRCQTINCSRFTADLIESELFGHVKGAFTGADADRDGLLVALSGGTLILDEIGELTAPLQARLLRVIEYNKVRPVGSNNETEFSTRLVAVTNRDLTEECLRGDFRQDLYERLQSFQLSPPPLRQRRADISLLAKLFLDQFNGEKQGRNHWIKDQDYDLLIRYDWPGNVRQLRGAVREAATFARTADGPVSGTRLRESLQRRRTTRPSQHSIPFDPQIDTWEDVKFRSQKIYLETILAEAEGKRADAIERSGMSKARFYQLLKDFEIK